MVQIAPIRLTGYRRRFRRVVQPMAGGVVSMPGDEFSAGEGFPHEWLSRNIDEKCVFALLKDKSAARSWSWMQTTAPWWTCLKRVDRETQPPTDCWSGYSSCG